MSEGCAFVCGLFIGLAVAVIAVCVTVQHMHRLAVDHHVGAYVLEDKYGAGNAVEFRWQDELK